MWASEEIRWKGRTGNLIFSHWHPSPPVPVARTFSICPPRPPPRFTDCYWSRGYYGYRTPRRSRLFHLFTSITIIGVYYNYFFLFTQRSPSGEQTERQRKEKDKKCKPSKSNYSFVTKTSPHRVRILKIAFHIVFHLKWFRAPVTLGLGGVWFGIMFA